MNAVANSAASTWAGLRPAARAPSATSPSASRTRAGGKKLKITPSAISPAIRTIGRDTPAR
jgi:hypothetical protein